MTDPRTLIQKPSASLWKAISLSPWRLTRNVLGDIRSNGFFARASELAFDFLFALFPLILFMLTLFGLFASRSVELQTDLLFYFADFLPPTAFQLLRTTTSELAANSSNGVLTFGIVTALWFASGGVSSMISALNLAYRVIESRSWIKVRAISLGLTLAISVLLLAALLIVLVSSHFVDWMGLKLHLQPSTVAVSKFLQWPTAVFFVIVSYSLIYFFGPDLKERCWHWVSPGSAFGASVWLVSSLCLRAYLGFFNSYSALYGSLGAVMILLAWLYMTGLAFLVGGEINAEIERAATSTHSLQT